MRILKVVADGGPGGGTTHVLQLLEGLRGTCSVGLVTQEGSYLLKEARALEVPSFGVDFFRSRLDLRIPLRLRRIVREFGAHIVHVHGGRAAFFYSLAHTRVPFVYSVHGYHFLHKGPVTRCLALLAERFSSSRAFLTIFVSRHDARIAQAYSILPDSSRSAVVHNGIQLQELPPSEPESLKHAGFVGRLEYQKDPILFLDTLECLPGHSATIVGGGSLEHKVRTEIERRKLTRVRMVGALAHSETLRVISGLGVLVMTSRWEGLPMLPIEAMWAGVPVVATRVGGLDEVIENEESGLLVEGRSPGDIARAVRRVTGDAALRERLVKNGRERVRSTFSEERMLSEIREIYRRVAEA